MENTTTIKTAVVRLERIIVVAGPTIGDIHCELEQLFPEFDHYIIDINEGSLDLENE